ncbi:hypothetical protein J6590_004641 [Homalodisca vitripennis]|nr:hypothetical protein J6590_004641 [Homalodisca vitripennis]
MAPLAQSRRCPAARRGRYCVKILSDDDAPFRAAAAIGGTAGGVLIYSGHRRRVGAMLLNINTQNYKSSKSAKFFFAVDVTPWVRKGISSQVLREIGPAEVERGQIIYSCISQLREFKSRVKVLWIQEPFQSLPFLPIPPMNPCPIAKEVKTVNQEQKLNLIKNKPFHCAALRCSVL